MPSGPDADSQGSKDAGTAVSSKLWIYFAVTIPLTATIVGSWWWFDRRREAQYLAEDADLEKSIDKMEKDILFHLRRRTMSKATTWTSMPSPLSTQAPSCQRAARAGPKGGGIVP